MPLMLKQFIPKIILGYILALISMVALSIVTTDYFKQRIAYQLAQVFSSSVIAGDNRRMMVELPRGAENDFACVKWASQFQGSSFFMPGNISGINPIVLKAATVPVFFDEAKTIPAGQFEFYYNRWVAVFWAFLAWLAIVIFSIPVLYREKNRFVREYNTSVQLRISESFAVIAAQVAHDIRSPLFALDAALRHAEQLPEKQRVMVRHAVNRIRDIANNLLEKNRQHPGLASTAASAGDHAGEPLDVYLLSSLIDPVITEKRLQFESKPGISVDFELTKESYGLFTRLQPAEFRRMISNLVNNAVEALGDKGVVDVRLAHEDKTIVLTISDDGKGIPPEILAKLGRRGETHGKTGGSGLGLFHARSTAESWGGSLVITSAPGKGTTVTIKLPSAEVPGYFVSELKLAPGRPIIVLDDDPGVHQIWRGRFESARTKEQGIEAFHFSEPEQLRAWVKENPEKAALAVCLFDYELAGFKETGLSLAEELGLCRQTILVSSRSEEPRIIAECTRLGVRIIPKGLAGLVPILIGLPAAPAAHIRGRAVLLDDDALTHMNWEDAAQANGIELKAFTSPAEFMAALGDFPKDIPLYIDSELGDGVKGENIAAELKEKGYTNICLATGHPPEKFAHLPWLKVITKEAPWGEKSEG